MITQEQVKSIAYYHNGGIQFNEEIMGEDYTPLQKTPEELSGETEKLIIQDYVDAYCKGENRSVTDYKIDKYFGTYNGYVACMIAPTSGGFLDEVRKEEVAGVIIRYRDSNSIKIWKNSYKK